MSRSRSCIPTSAPRTVAWIPWDLSAPPELLDVSVPDGSAPEDANLRAREAFEVLRRDSLFVDEYRTEVLNVAYDVFPDGRSLLMQKPSGTSTGEPVVVLNWPALLKRRRDSR
jgi:hypothetical protein